MDTALLPLPKQGGQRAGMDGGDRWALPCGDNQENARMSHLRKTQGLERAIGAWIQRTERLETNQAIPSGRGGVAWEWKH